MVSLRLKVTTPRRAALSRSETWTSSGCSWDKEEMGRWQSFKKEPVEALKFHFHRLKSFIRTLSLEMVSLPKVGHSISALNVESYDESHRLAHYVSNPQWNNKSLYHTVWVLSPRSSVIRHKIKKKKFFFPFPLLGSKTVCVCVQSLSCVWPFVASAYQAPLSMEFSRQEYWVGLPFPPPGDLSNPGIKPASLASPVLAGKFFTTELPGKPSGILLSCKAERNRKKILSLTQSLVGRIWGSIGQECQSRSGEETFLSSGSWWAARPVYWCWVEGGRQGARMWGPRRQGCLPMRLFFQQGSAHVLPVPQGTTYSQPRFFFFWIPWELQYIIYKQLLTTLSSVLFLKTCGSLVPSL